VIKPIAEPEATGAVVSGAVVVGVVVDSVVSPPLSPTQAVRENARTKVSAKQMPRVIRFFIFGHFSISNYSCLKARLDYI
jgi:hypothetical protein